MKVAILLTMLMISLAGCSTVQDRGLDVVPSDDDAISGTLGLVLNETELQQLGMTVKDCQTEQEYTNSVDSSFGQYTFCTYTVLKQSAPKRFTHFRLRYGLQAKCHFHWTVQNSPFQGL